MAPSHIVPGMRSIDIHAHITPQCFWRATEGKGDWHTLRREQDARGREYARGGQGPPGTAAKSRWTPEERLADMDSLGVDMHVLSPYSGFYNYELDTAVAIATAHGIQRRDPPDVQELARTLCRTGHPADARRQGGHH